MTAGRTHRLKIAAALLAIGAFVSASTPASAYLKLGFAFDGSIMSLKWARFPVPYRIYSATAPGVSINDFQVAVGRAFDTWEAVPTAGISYRYDGFTLNPPGLNDGITSLGFLPRPDLDRVLASTSFLVDGFTGELIESDILFNTSFLWSVAPGGQAGRYDVESIALHEIGHLSGLGHSLLGETEFTSTGRRVTAAESVMFPIAFSPGSVASRTLKADDIAGISDVYPAGAFGSRFGSVSGRVTQNGAGVFGAHVTAMHLASGALVSNFTLSETGQFSIAGLRPGPHVLRVEPLDDADVESFFDSDAVGLDFRVTFLPRLVVVPRAGDSGAVEIQVDQR